MSSSEIQRYRLLGQDAAHALEAVCLSFEPSDSELDIAASLAFQCLKRNILPLVNLVAGDERIARYRHPLPTGNRVRKTMLVALTGRRHGLHISLTRLVSFGPVDPGLLELQRAVVKVDARYILESRAGVTIGEVVSRAIDQYALEGFPEEWELHHQGGLTGYAGREIFGTPDSEYRLQHSQVLTWNPSITGAKSEDTILLTADCPEVLTRTDSWPELEVDLPVGTLRRPAILVRWGRAGASTWKENILAYQPIEDYGIVGNMRTIALVGINGSIDWFCCPKFDSPSIFGAILDEKKGGYFKIAPAQKGAATHKQLYWPETNVLITRFLSPGGVAEVTDFMPVDYHGHEHEVNHLIRRVNIVRGTMALRMECFPATNYGRDEHEIRMNDSGAMFLSPNIRIQLSTTMPLVQNGSGVVCDFTLHEGQTLTFSIAEVEDESDICFNFSEEESEHLFEETVDYWRNWLSQSTYRGRWQEMVERSALVLKLLTYEPTGAIVAAPTCSLPEGIGGERNWDYRYTWIRDAAFTLYALLRIGFTDAAAKFMGWIEDRAAETGEDGALQIMYGIDGRHELNEETLTHLEGYKGSSPVRVGNGAYGQLQLDIYGELMDAVYLYNKYRTPISYDFWTHLSRLTDWVVDNWRRTDEGIWEVRSGQRHFVYSKLMCWVAIDRAIRLADKRSFPADRARWHAARDEIYREIMEKGWSEERQAFVQSYGSDTLDASNLMMPLVFFMSPTDPRMLKTLDAMDRSPANGGLVSNSLVYRYDVNKTDDGLEGEEGSFNICTFWMVEAMTRAGQTDRRRLHKARLMFEKMLSYANHLGLYSEQIGTSGEALGNFPQAFTHLALISAAFNLDRALGRKP